MTLTYQLNYLTKGWTVRPLLPRIDTKFSVGEVANNTVFKFPKLKCFCLNPFSKIIEFVNIMVRSVLS